MGHTKAYVAFYHMLKASEIVSNFPFWEGWLPVRPSPYDCDIRVGKTIRQSLRVYLSWIEDQEAEYIIPIVEGAIG